MSDIRVHGNRGRRRCSLCEAAPLGEMFYVTDRNLSTTRERFLVARCTACGVAQTLPQPSEATLSQYYPRWYYPEAGQARRYYERVVHGLHAEKLLRIRQYVSEGRLLDVGCGIGYFVQAAADAGYESEGLELDEETAVQGRELWKLPIRSGTLSSLESPGRRYDVATFWQAFEHMQRPHEVLEMVRTLLRRGGLLVIAVPNFSSLQSAVFRSHWYHLDVPRHMFHYDPKSLAALVSQHGFQVERIRFHSREHDWAGILGSMMRLAPVGEGTIHKIVRKTIGYYLSLVLAAIEASIRRGGTFELYARKDDAA